VPTSLERTGLVGTVRDGKGSDGEFFGVDPVPVDVDLHDARGAGLTLDAHGFQLVEHKYDHVDYYNNNQVLSKYYPEVEALVTKALGAKRCLAFDHNVRSRNAKIAGKQLEAGNAVQEPLVGYGVHNDYTAASAVARVRQMAEPPKENDTLRPILGDTPPLDPKEIDSLLAGRWMLLNVWRNISPEPVLKFPLALSDGQSCPLEDLVVFEIRYSDRIGENYFARYSPQHKWYYYPKATRDEAVLLKVWDSRGKAFCKAPDKQTETVPVTFTLHSAFDDPATPPDAPDRESIEVRTIVFY